LLSEKDPENPTNRSALGHPALQRIAEGTATMKNQRFDSVWDALEISPQEAENMKLRSNLMRAIQNHMARSELSQSQAAKLFGVTQPRVSDLMRGKIHAFSLDTLVNMAAAVGLQIDLKVAESA
jgi:predicted XRE-type DNA-binding protein